MDHLVRKRRVAIALGAGLIMSAAAAGHQRVASDSLRMVGYTEVLSPCPFRPWWVELHDYVSGLWWAHQVASMVAPRQLPDEERVARLASWVFEHFIGVDPLLPLQEDHFFNTARRGYGSCDQQAHVLAVLYWSAGYPTRLRMLRNDQGISPHTLTEVRVRGRWVMVDPSFRILFRDVQGYLMTVEELAKFPEWLEAYRAQGASLTVADFQRGTFFTTFPYLPWGAAVKKSMTRLFSAPPPYHEAPQSSSGEHEPLPSSAVRSWPRLPRGIRQFDRGRRCELLGRDAAAKRLYLRTIQDPLVSDPVRRIARYRLARMAWRQRNKSACLRELEPLLSASTTQLHPGHFAAARLWGRCTVMLEESIGHHQRRAVSEGEMAMRRMRLQGR